MVCLAKIRAKNQRRQGWPQYLMWNFIASSNKLASFGYTLLSLKYTPNLVIVYDNNKEAKTNSLDSAYTHELIETTFMFV